MLNLLVKPVWVLMEMEVQDQVGHDAWGLYAALLSLGFLLLTLADMGINQYATKTLASQPEQLQAYFPTLFSTKLLLTLVYPLLMLGIGWGLGYEAEALWLLLWLSLVQAGNNLAQFFRANFQAMQRFRLDAWLSVAERLALILLTLGLFFTTLTLERFVMARLLAVGLVIGLFYLLIARSYGWLRPRFRGLEVKRVLRYSFSFALLTVLYSVLDKIDQVMLERLVGPVENGLYVGAYRWLEAFSMFLWIILPIFFARFAYYPDQPAKQQRLLLFGQKITAIPLLFVSLFVMFFGEKLLFLFDGSSSQQVTTMTQCLQVLFIAVAINSIFSIYSTLLTSTGHERYVNRLILGGIALNVVLNGIFIPQYGAVASAWTTVVSYAAMNLAYVVYIEWRLDLRISYRQLGRLLLLAGLGGAIFWGLSQWPLPWWLVTGLAGMLYLALTWLLGLIRRSDWENLRKE